MSFKEQADEVLRVKSFESGMVVNPLRLIQIIHWLKTDNKKKKIIFQGFQSYKRKNEKIGWNSYK